MRFVETLLQAVIGLAIVAAAWWIAAWRADSLLLPGPVAVASRALELLSADAFREHLWASLRVLLFGLAPALALGVLIGALAGASTTMRWLLLGPLTLTIAAAPVVVLVPHLAVSLGLGMTTTVVLVLLAGTFSTANTVMVRWPRRGALKVDAPSAPGTPSPGTPSPGTPSPGAPSTPSAPSTPGAPSAPKIVRPGPAPAIFAGLRVGVLMGVTGLVVGELVASQTGLATFAERSLQSFNTADGLAAALLIIVPTIVVGVLLQAIEEQLAV